MCHSFPCSPHRLAPGPRYTTLRMGAGFGRALAEQVPTSPPRGPHWCAHHGVGEELLWLRHRHAAPRGAGGDSYREHHANTRLPASPAGHAVAAPGSRRQPGRASRHRPAPRAKHKPSHASHRPPAQSMGFIRAAATGASLRHWRQLKPHCGTGAQRNRPQVLPPRSGQAVVGAGPGKHAWVAVPDTHLGTSACCPARPDGACPGLLRAGAAPSRAGSGGVRSQAGSGQWQVAPTGHGATGVECLVAWREGGRR